MEDFDRSFCQAIEESRRASQRWIESYRDGGRAIDAFQEIQQVFGDAFICAGYLIGHLHGLELNGAEQAPQAKKFLSQDPLTAELMVRLGPALHQLYLSEFGWRSLEVFAPIYDLICEMMALRGLAFSRHGDEWRVVMSDEPDRTPALRDFLLSKAREAL